ncbi:uncharacterized protein LOC119437078 isoform X2 [Dermacentor silvarum]|uniref:uncharacterized protein LOC119437078 isoform X2 n=1 Tax=Dermacentor silvarum TaxID=543639 RepID=UPI001896BA91|nr:uncharacterized protein LOC119437078 isoform X2 [Dermacentor silvarum]
MACSCNAVACFRCASGLIQGVAGVVQCMFALLLRLSQEDGLEFGLNLLLGVTNIPLGCAIATALTQRTECREPQEYVSLNRLNVALSWHSALFNAVCALVLVVLPSPPHSQADQVTPTRFHSYWLVALDYVYVASVVIPVIVVALSFCCLLTLTRSPLRTVVPSRESVAFVQEGKTDDIMLRPYKWVYHGTDRSLSSRELHLRGRRPQSPNDDSLRYPPPRFTFKRCSGSCSANLSRPGPSHTDGDQSRANQPGGSRVGRPTATAADASTGCSTDDFDDDCALDSFISDSFDESVWAAAADNRHHHPGAGLAKNARTSEVSKATSTIDSTCAETERERRVQLRRGASAYRGEDSLASLTNLELIARQWRTSAMLRRIWRSSERASSRKQIRPDQPMARD